jgi:hypothetical protein
MVAVSLFHVSVLYLEAGELVHPGGWGRRIKATGVRHVCYFRELELERARLRIAPDAPSRWTSAFAFSALSEAVPFAAGRQQQEKVLIYEVSTQDGAATISVPMGHIDAWNVLELPEAIEPWADGYWTAAPYAGPGGEVLVDGSLTVVRRIPFP